MKIIREQMIPLCMILIPLCMAIVCGAIQYSLHIATSGIIASPSLSVSPESINWGIIYPGTSVSETIEVTNTGNVAVKLSFSTTNWNPSSAENYMSLAWDYDETPLSVGTTKTITLTLVVFSNITGITSFNFDIVITAEG